MEGGYTVHSLPAEERPRERLLRGGCGALATAELLAIILGSGMRGKSVLVLAQELLARFATVEQLSQATVQELCQVKGMGIAKAVQLKAAFALGSRAARGGEEMKQKILSPQQAYSAFKECFQGAASELFAALLLDIKGQLIALEIIAQGGLSEAAIHPRELFYPAIRQKAAKLIIAHNHPSGDPTPSSEDYAATEALAAAGRLIGIPISDHLILGKGKYHSMREHGFVFNG